MDTASLRPPASATPVLAARPVEKAPPAAENVASEAAVVRPSSEAEALRDQERRAGDPDERAAAAHKGYRLNPAAATYVWQAVDETSGEVVSQIPSDAYLIQKAAYRRALAADTAGAIVDRSA